MEEPKHKHELRQVSHLMMLLVMVFFSVVLLVLNRVLNWELWMIPVILTGTTICWALHIGNHMPERVQIYVCGIFLMFLTFYYTVNVDMAYGSMGVIGLLIFLLAVTGEKFLLLVGTISGCLGMYFRLVRIHEEQKWSMTTAHLVQSAWQILLVLLAAFLADRIVLAWKNTEKGLQDTIRRISEENAKVNQFLTNVSHEIRTPANAVMGLSAVLEKENLPEAVMKNIVAISDAGHRVAEQISDILDYAEIDMGKLSVNKESYMIDSLINDLLAQLSFMEDYGLDLVIDMEADVPAELLGDGSKIKKILWHLVGNGFKYTREGGVYVHIYAIKREYGINLILEVKDTGIGMSEEEIEHIYDKFYQSDSGRSRATGGLGLGVPIIDGFVKAMGGVVTVIGEPGRGTTVRVSIPQEIVDPSPCLSVTDKEVCVAGFLDFVTTKHPKIREYYMEMISHLSTQLSVPFYRVTSVEELKRVLESGHITHVFVGTGEYLANKDFIEKLAKKTNVALVADRGFQVDAGAGLVPLKKPFHVVQVVYLLNHSFEEKDISDGERMTCPGIRALVVDDEPMNLLVARGIFEAYGMVVTTANGGAEAIEVCRNTDFDIIFMDHMMPDMDGVETMKRLRLEAEREKKELCIVALTANAISTAKEMFLSEGFDGFVPKPIEIIDLERVLKHVLPKSAIVYQKISDAKVTGRVSSDGPGGQTSYGNLTQKAAGMSDQILGLAKEGDSNDPYERLAECGVDTAQGLRYCQGEQEFYRQVLLEYAKNPLKKEQEIRQFFEEKNWKDYAIRVHAVKSTSKMIGAAGLSEMAKHLEDAAKKEDGEEIAKNHLAFLSNYVHLLKSICAAFGTQASSEDEILEFEPQGGDEILEFEPQSETEEGGEEA